MDEKVREHLDKLVEFGEKTRHVQNYPGMFPNGKLRIHETPKWYKIESLKNNISYTYMFVRVDKATHCIFSHAGTRPICSLFEPDMWPEKLKWLM